MRIYTHLRRKPEVAWKRGLRTLQMFPANFERVNMEAETSSIRNLEAEKLTVFKHISKHFEIRQNYASCCFKSLLGGGDVVKYGLSCFDILLKLDSKQLISLRANTQLQDSWGCHKNMTSEG